MHTYHTHTHTYIFIKYKWKYAIHTSLILLFSLKSDLGHLSISAHGDIPYFSLFLMIKFYSIHSKVASEKLPCAWHQARYLEVELRRTLQHTPPQVQNPLWPLPVFCRKAEVSQASQSQNSRLEQLMIRTIESQAQCLMHIPVLFYRYYNCHQRT